MKLVLVQTASHHITSFNIKPQNANSFKSQGDLAVVQCWMMVLEFGYKPVDVNWRPLHWEDNTIKIMSNQKYICIIQLYRSSYYKMEIVYIISIVIWTESVVADALLNSLLQNNQSHALGNTVWYLYANIQLDCIIWLVGWSLCDTHCSKHW